MANQMGQPGRSERDILSFPGTRLVTAGADRRGFFQKEQICQKVFDRGRKLITKAQKVPWDWMFCPKKT